VSLLWLLQDLRGFIIINGTTLSVVFFAFVVMWRFMRKRKLV
jgi:hypothetical protein